MGWSFQTNRAGNHVATEQPDSVNGGAGGETLGKRIRTLRLRAVRQWYLGQRLASAQAGPAGQAVLKSVPKDAILCFVTQRNERIRLPYFLIIYLPQRRDRHFSFVDNDSDDGSAEYRPARPTCRCGAPRPA